MVLLFTKSILDAFFGKRAMLLGCWPGFLTRVSELCLPIYLQIYCYENALFCPQCGTWWFSYILSQ